MTLELRDYQRSAVAAVREAWATGTRRPAVVLPTGAGKTIVFSDLMTGGGRPPGRGLVIAHRDELIEQAVAKIRSVAAGARVGVVKGNRDEVGADYVVGSIQTLRHPGRRERVRNVGLIVVDECHHATAPSYLAVLEHYGAIVGDTTNGRSAVAVGFTATMSRGDGVGLGQVWEEIVYEATISDMIGRGWLVEPRGVRVDVEDLNLDQVRRSRGDYQDGALGAALADSMAPKRIVEAWAEHAAGRPTILFSPTVEFARIMSEEFAAAGVSARLVHGMMPAEDRRRALAEFKAGDVTVLCNCMVLTEGTDLPLASCCVVARPTTHAGLYIQMIGRVLRPFPGKVDALVLDVAGASKRHALRSTTDLVGTDDLIEGDDDENVEPEPAEFEPVELDALGIPAKYRDGKLVSETVDLFHGSRNAWNRTRAGVWFLEAGKRYIVLVPGLRDGEWDAASIGRTYGTGSRWIVRGVPDMSYAMAHAEQAVTPAEHTLALRERSWRRKQPSEKQLRYAGSLGLSVRPGMRSGEVSALIAYVEASTRIDAAIPGYARGRLARGY